MKKFEKILLYVVPPVVIIGAIYLINRKKSEKKISDGIKNSPLPEPVIQPSTSQPAQNFFPLKKSSNNEKVGDLQRILGISADNAFGSQTESALKLFSGKTTVDSQAELDALAAKKSTQQNLSVSLDRAKQLLSQFQSGGKNIYTQANTIAYGYVQDFSGAIKYNSKNISMPLGKRYNNTDYKLIGYTKSGNLEMNVLSGQYTGTYIINPNTITLVT